MFSTLAIKNFRGIQLLTLTGLRRINLISGRNNSGKTSVLESLFMLSGASNPLFTMKIGQLRGQRSAGGNGDGVWRSLFHEMNPRTPILLRGAWNAEARERQLEIEALQVASYSMDASSSEGVSADTDDFEIGGLQLRYAPAADDEVVTKAIFDPRTGNVDAPGRQRPDFFRSSFLSARSYSSLDRDANQFSHLVRIKQDGDVLMAMRIIESRIKRIEVLSENGGPAVYVDLGFDSLIPLPACGEGFVRLFSIIVELTACRGGVLLIDEIDNGLHYSVLEALWALLGALAAKHDVQVFGTTHNDDLIRSALQAFSGEPAILGLYRIDRMPTGHVAVSYNDESRQAVMEEHFEVRG